MTLFKYPYVPTPIRLGRACTHTRPSTVSLEQLVRRLRKRVLWAGDQGGALIEMALVLPMLLLILTGIFAFGVALNNYLELTDATSISARYLAVNRQQALDPCAVTVATFYKAAPYLKQSNLTFSFVLNGTSYPGTSCSSTSYTTGAAGNLVKGQPAQMTVTYPCNLVVYGKNYAPSCTMAAQTTEIVQ